MDHLVRNSDGDELLFIHEGSGELYCDYGHLTIRDGDYLVLPRGTMWRLETTAPVRGAAHRSHQRQLSASRERSRRRTCHIRLRCARHAAPSTTHFAPNRRKPSGASSSNGAAALSVITYPFNPLDALGWHGTLAPVRLNWRDLRPLMSHRYHLPPSAHTTFAASALRRQHVLSAPVGIRSGSAEAAVLSQQRRLRRSDLLSPRPISVARQYPSRG